MKTARRRTPKLPGSPARQTNTWRGRSEQILLNQLGCEARKIAAMGEIFFLTSTFIEQTGHYSRVARNPGLTNCQITSANGFVASVRPTDKIVTSCFRSACDSSEERMNRG